MQTDKYSSPEQGRSARGEDDHSEKPGATIAEGSSEIDQVAKSIRTNLGSMHKNVFEIGRSLLRAKEILGHGNFQPWLRAEFAWSVRTAQQFMNVAMRLGDKCESLSHLGVEALYKLSAPSTPDEIIEKITISVEAGEKVTSQVVTEMIRQAKTPPSNRERLDPNPASAEGIWLGQTEQMTQQAFALLKVKLDRTRLQRIAYLLTNCDVGALIKTIESHLGEKSRFQ